MIDTGKIKEIEKDIAKIERDQKASESKIEGYRERIKRLLIQQGEFEARRNALREARQAALVNGEDTVSLTKELKTIDSEAEIITDELQGLQKAISDIESKAAGTTEQITALKREAKNLRVVVLARKLNQELPKIAELLLEYDEALQQTNNCFAGGLVYVSETNTAPHFSNVNLPKLYIKGEFDCSDARMGIHEHIQNYFFLSKYDNAYFRKNPGWVSLNRGNVRDFKD